MIVDVNAYYGNWPFWPTINADAESMLRKMDEYGIDRAFVSSLNAVFADIEAGNREVIDVVNRHPDRFLPAFVYSPYSADPERYSVDCREAEACIVKLSPLNHGYDLLEEPYIHDLLSFCGENGIPVMIPRRLMMTWRLPILDIRPIGTLAQAHPETAFIIASVNYLLEYQTAISLMRDHPNIYVETSAMMAYQGIETVVSEVGAERVLHGSCNPLQYPAIGPMKIQKAEIRNEQKQQILGGNATRLTRLA